MLIINLVSSHNDHHGLPIVLVVVSLNYILSVWNYNGGEQLNCTESSHFVPFKSSTLDAMMMRMTMMGTIFPIQRLSTSNTIQFCCSSWSLCPIFSFWENNEGHGWPGLNSSLTVGEPTSNGNYLWFSHCPALITRNFCGQQQEKRAREEKQQQQQNTNCNNGGSVSTLSIDCVFGTFICWISTSFTHLPAPLLTWAT